MNYEILVNAQTHMVRGGSPARFLGAFGTNFWRSWVFPLYTPGGQTVVREFPFDHPFHNGVFVGQNPVKVGGVEGNFWAIPGKRSHDDHIAVRIGRMDGAAPGAKQAVPVAEVRADGVHFSLKSVWRDEAEQALVDEERTVHLQALPDGTVCDMVSHKIAAYGAAEFSKTKFGSIGARVEPRLLPPLGGVIIGCADGVLQRGGADEVANGQACDAVAYEADVPGVGCFGVCLMIRANSASPSRRGPWFIRDYGMAMFNPTQEEAILLPEGASWTVALRAVAYDGALSAERLAAWQE